MSSLSEAQPGMVTVPVSDDLLRLVQSWPQWLRSFIGTTTVDFVAEAWWVSRIVQVPWLGSSKWRITVSKLAAGWVTRTNHESRWLVATRIMAAMMMSLAWTLKKVSSANVSLEATVWIITCGSHRSACHRSFSSRKSYFRHTSDKCHVREAKNLAKSLGMKRQNHLSEEFIMHFIEIDLKKLHVAAKVSGVVSKITALQITIGASQNLVSILLQIGKPRIHT